MNCFLIEAENVCVQCLVMKASKIKFFLLFWDVVSSLCWWGMNVASLLRGTESKLSNWFSKIYAFMTSSGYKSRRSIWQWWGDHVPSASTFAVCKYLGFCVALKTWTLIDPIYKRETASNFYSKRDTLKSGTLIKLSSANLWDVRWAWFLNLNLKDVEAISCEPDPSLRDSVALISHSKQIKYPACCQSCVIEQSYFFFPPQIYFQNMLVIRSWCKHIFPLSKMAQMKCTLNVHRTSAAMAQPPLSCPATGGGRTLCKGQKAFSRACSFLTCVFLVACSAFSVV